MKSVIHVEWFRKQLLIGLLAMATLFGSTYHTFSQSQDTAGAPQDITNTEEDSTTPEIYQVSYEAVMPILKPSIAPLVFLVIELNLIGEIDFQPVVYAYPDLHAFFNVLFRLIISPNGP